jgi:hypothetical protein
MWSCGCPVCKNQPGAGDAWSGTNIKTVLDLKHVLLGYYFISFEEEFGPSCDCT